MARNENKKIARNTILLYFRMFLMMAVTIYTSRVILKVLGIDDYGTYNLIGGFITIFSFISGSLVGAVQRYFNIALGKKDNKEFNDIYSMSINIFLLFSFALLLICETVGVWFVVNKLNIPTGRETAAFWVFQFSVLTLISGLIRSSDNAAIIAYERMDFYAVLSLAEAFLKLGIVFLLEYILIDKLILYVILYFIATIIITVIYKVYTSRNFDTCHYQKIWNIQLFRSLLSFSGWSLINSGMHAVSNQGITYGINHYYSVSVNAAQGLAAQVYNALNLFLTNFQTAFKPQLVKTYAAGEMESHYRLIYRTAKFSYLLMLILVVPAIYNLKYLLGLWLVEVPLYTEYFCIFSLLAYLADSIGAPLQTSIYAQGEIKGLQIYSALLHLILLAISFILLRMGCAPYIPALLTMVVHVLFVVISMYYAKKLCGVVIKDFSVSVLLPSTIVSGLALVIPYCIASFATNFARVVAVMAIDMLWIAAIAYVFGLTKIERNFIQTTITSRFSKFIKK